MHIWPGFRIQTHTVTPVQWTCLFDQTCTECCEDQSACRNEHLFWANKQLGPCPRKDIYQVCVPSSHVAISQCQIIWKGLYAIRIWPSCKHVRGSNKYWLVIQSRSKCDVEIGSQWGKETWRGFSQVGWCTPQGQFLCDLRSFMKVSHYGNGRAIYYSGWILNHFGESWILFEGLFLCWNFCLGNSWILKYSGILGCLFGLEHAIISPKCKDKIQKY